MKTPTLWLGLLLLVGSTFVTFRSASGRAFEEQTQVASGAKPKLKQKAPKPGSEKAIKAFMRQKLTAMKLVLRGIVTEDYDLIQKNAARMQKMGTQAEWNIVQGPIYGDYQASFRRSAELLSKAAKNKNADAAMLVYMQSTLNCIECHRYVRGPTVRRKNRVQ